MVSSGDFSSQKLRRIQTLHTSSLCSSLWGQGGQLLTQPGQSDVQFIPKGLHKRGLDTFGKTPFDTLISDSLSKIHSFLIRN